MKVPALKMSETNGDVNYELTGKSMLTETTTVIHLKHSQNVDTGETKDLLELELQMSEEYLPETENITPLYVFPLNEGQVVPCQNTVPKADDTESGELYQAEIYKRDECLTIPQMQIDGKSIRSPEKGTEVDNNSLEDGKCLQIERQDEKPNNVIVMAKEEGLYDMKCTKFQWPAMGIRNANAESNNSIDKPDISQQQPALDENENHSASPTSPVSASGMPATANSPETVTDAVEEKYNTVEHPYTQPSSILKKNPRLTQGEKISVHFSENIVSVRLYDVSDDEDDSDADTVILSDTEESLAADQQVPSNNFSELCSLTVDDDNDDCLSSHSRSSMNVDFKAQFSFPPAIKIANYQLFDDSPEEEEQMFENMEISVEETQDVAEVVLSTTKTEFQDHEYGLYDMFTTASPSEPEKMTAMEEPIEITHFKTCALESHTGVTEGSSAGNTDTINPGSPEIEICSDGEQRDAKAAVNKASLEGEHRDAKNETSVEEQTSIPSMQEQTSFLGSRCGSHFLWRERRSIDSMLIDESFHDVSPLMSTKNESIRPANILQTITEEEVFHYYEQIIDVVTHETNILKLSQEKAKSIFAGPSQCHARPEKHIIHAFISSPDQFNHFDTWAPNSDCDSKQLNKGEGNILKDSIEGGAENVSPKKRLFNKNNQVTAAEIHKYVGIPEVEDRTSSEYSRGPDLICKFDEKRELVFSSDVPEEDSRVSFPTAATTKRGQRSLESFPERCNGHPNNKRLKTDLASARQIHSLAIPRDPQLTRPPQIVPEIETGGVQVFRKRPEVQSTEAALHAVPPDMDDDIVNSSNTSFHLEEHSFQKCNISEGITTCDSEPGRLTEPGNTARILQLSGYDIQPTECAFNEKLLSFAGKYVEARQPRPTPASSTNIEKHEGQACENRRADKNNFDWEARNTVNDHIHSVFKTATGLFSTETHILVKQGRKKLRVGMSKSTKIKPLHPYWTKNRIK